MEKSRTRSDRKHAFQAASKKAPSMKLPRQPKTYPIDELLQALAEDGESRRVVAWICRQNDFQRRSLIRTQLDTMRLKGAPAELMALLKALEDPALAARTARFLDGEET